MLAFYLVNIFYVDVLVKEFGIELIQLNAFDKINISERKNRGLISK